MANLDKLKEEIESKTDIENGALALVSGVVNELQRAHDSSDWVRVDALINDLSAQAPNLARAIITNTPVADPDAPWPIAPGEKLESAE